ncbi:hypothetical protein [Caenimonas soli]|uniref:hypothetical protein n=1 Tax=Caenimonas soli TaxID=2735555 RepID=UPI0015578804|nr:hypothetical protein [Caenimonas soli]NPC55305.1 hypothetical protein [Caenimonas soli]
MPDKQETLLDPAPDRLVEAARYALLRRLAFAMRHHMVVHLQPIGMITEVMERRLQSASPDLAQMHESMTKINGFSRAAVQSCLDVVSWLAPESGAVVALDEGVGECMALLRSGFNFRGFTLKDEVGSVSLPVARAGLRNVLPACLLALTDRVTSPADLVVSAQPGSGQAMLTVAVRPGQGSPGFAGDAPYRLLEWHEVEALARADGIAVDRSGEQVRLTIPAA